MKKIMSILFAALASSPAFAQEIEEHATNPLAPGRTVTIRFYGSEASNNAANPCQGPCISVCGEVTYEAVDEVYAIETTKWTDSQEIRQRTVLIEDILFELPELDPDEILD